MKRYRLRPVAHCKEAALCCPGYDVKLPFIVLVWKGKSVSTDSLFILSRGNAQIFGTHKTLVSALYCRNYFKKGLFTI